MIKKEINRYLLISVLFKTHPFFGIYKSVIVFVKTSDAKPTVSPNVGCGWTVKLRSSASAPISIARTASDIKSPAPVPTIPTPKTLLFSGENSILVFP